MDDYNLMMNSECVTMENLEQSEMPTEQQSEIPSKTIPIQNDLQQTVNEESIVPIRSDDDVVPNEICNNTPNVDEPEDKTVPIEEPALVHEHENDVNNVQIDAPKPDESEENNIQKENSNESSAETKTDTNADADKIDNKDAEKQEKEEETINPSQCRICLSTENLLDIFTVDTKTHFRICDLIMKLCTTVKISERDYLPHYVCGVCVQRIDSAWELRLQCEETEKLLRSKLKRSKKTTRRAPAEFVLISKISSSESDGDDDQSEDEEFQLSEESDESSESDSDESYEEKKKPPPPRRRRPPPPPPSKPMKRSTATPSYHPSKQSRIGGVVHIPAMDSDDERLSQRRQIQSRKPLTPGVTKVVSVFKCDVCNRFCSTAEALKQHRRTHADEKCPICSKIFKQRGALLQHIQKHKEDNERICGTCHKEFTTKNDCKRHIQTAHSQPLTCDKCKRSFPSKGRLDAHKCNNEKQKCDTDYSTNTGRDLFKSVAPLTTTYWSDSFSD